MEREKTSCSNGPQNRDEKPGQSMNGMLTLIIVDKPGHSMNGMLTLIIIDISFFFKVCRNDNYICQCMLFYNRHFTNLDHYYLHGDINF